MLRPDRADLEVIACTEGSLVELDGRTGWERRRLAIPPEPTDCLIVAYLTAASARANAAPGTRSISLS